MQLNQCLENNAQSAAFIKKKVLNYVSFHFKKLKKEQNKPKASRGRKSLKRRSKKNNEIENELTIGKIKTKTQQFFEKSITIDKPLAILTKKTQK